MTEYGGKYHRSELVLSKYRDKVPILALKCLLDSLLIVTV